jgi:hypothetical protein
VKPVAARVSQSEQHQVTSQVISIRDRLAQVRAMLTQMDTPSPRLLNMTERLEDLVKEIDQL